MHGRYFGTQGGGIAVEQGDQMVWQEAPEWLDAKPGDPVPEEWDIVGPFDSDTNMPVDDSFD